jgi:hypothetical protein
MVRTMKYIILKTSKGKHTIIDIADNIDTARRIGKNLKERSKETILLIPFDENKIEKIT